MLLQAKGLTKTYGRRSAVGGVDLEIEAGETVALLGPNGAGKTTTLRMLAGFLEPDEGSVRILSYEMTRHRTKAQSVIGYLPEGAPLYSEMTPLSYLNFMAHARGLSGDNARWAISRAATQVQLGDTLNQPISTLSKGYRRRTALAAAILHNPPILLLDEPTDGLDPNQNYSIRALIKELAPEKAILISTHNLEDVESMCTRAVVISAGIVVADGTPAALANETPNRTLIDFFRAVTRQEDAA
ncbi:MAG: ABC transporter ATP-binding protein [Caulobacterales bacterium]